MAVDHKDTLAINLGASGLTVALISEQGKWIGDKFEEAQPWLLPQGG